MIDTKKYEGHTPGPWEVVGAPDHIHAHRIFHKTKYIGSISNSDCSLEDMEPDARLIADAPMLLESLITAEARIKELEARESCEGCERKRTMTCNYDCRRDKKDYYRAALKGKE